MITLDSAQHAAFSPRFSIASVMFATAAFAVLFTYLKLFEPHELLMGVQIVAVVSVVGVAIGAYFERIADAAYWSILGAMTAFLCSVGEPLTHESFQYAWPLVGALTAASGILLDRYRLLPRMAIGAMIGAGVLALFSLLPSRLGATNTWIEVVCGPVAGAIMVGVVWMLKALRNWRGYSRAKLLFALTIGVVVGNIFGRWAGWL